MHSSCKPASLSEQVAALVGLALVAFLVCVAPAQAGDIAVVVHPEVKVDNLAFAELRKILLGDRQFWSSGQQVTLIVRAPGAAERKVLLEKIYKMSEAQFRQYWVAKVFRAQATSGPRVVVSNQESVELVGVLAGAIALVDADDVPSGLKVLSIDDLKPGDPSYALSRTPAD